MKTTQPSSRSVQLRECNASSLRVQYFSHKRLKPSDVSHHLHEIWYTGHHQSCLTTRLRCKTSLHTGSSEVARRIDRLYNVPLRLVHINSCYQVCRSTTLCSRNCHSTPTQLCKASARRLTRHLNSRNKVRATPIK